MPHCTVSDSTAGFSTEKRCEGTAGLESRVLFYKSSKLKTGKKRRKKKKKSISIRPATSLQSYMFPAAASALRCHEVIKLIHNYQTLPFSTNESPQSIFLQSLKRNRDLQPSSMAAVCSEVARPGRTSQHAKEVTWSHHFSTFKFKEEKTINGVGELHRPSGLHNYNHNANVHIHKLTCP